MNAKSIAAVGAALTVLTVVIGVLLVGGAASQQADAATRGVDVCATTGPLAGLSAAAAENARIVAATAERSAGSAGAVIAVAVGIAESGLRVLGNVDGQQGAAPVQGVGADHDSIGIFQQRPSWGSVAQRLDPALSTGLFVSRLLADPGWQSKPPWAAAQDVQVSAYDGQPRAANHWSATYGGNYKAAIGQARELVAVIDKDAASLSCGSLTHGEANAVGTTRGLVTAKVLPPILARPPEAACRFFTQSRPVP